MLPSYEQFVCLSGLPRSGSTLLSCILNQNPKIHASGNSAICQLMWDTCLSCKTNCREQLCANNMENFDKELISSIPCIYYKNIKKPIIIDKCRSWTLKDNNELLAKYIDPNFKIIVLFRPIIDIIKSFGKLYKKNNIYTEEKLLKLLETNSEPIMRSLNGFVYAKLNNSNNNFIFFEYNDLVNEPKKTIDKIYDFCGWEYFEHNFNNIVNYFPENDNVYGLVGMHQVRNSISLESNENIELPEKIVEICNNIDLQLKKIFSQ